jgi:hypothetical protein
LELVRIRGIRQGKGGGDFEPLAAGKALALGHLCYQPHLLEPDGHRLQLAETSALAAHVAAPASWTHQQLVPDN